MENKDLLPELSPETRHSQKLIIQFGRLDRYYQDIIKFSYEGENGEADLTSSFIVETDTLKGAKRLIIFPISIIFQDHLLSKEDDLFIEKIKKINIEEYLHIPEILLKQHPQARSTNLLVVSSLGTYEFKNDEYKFNGTLDIITLQIYLYLLSEFSFDELQEIYIDISSGQNIYISALINALYRFLPFIKFKRFLYSENESVLGWIISSDPIVGKPKGVINIQKSKFSAKAFNTFPYKDFGKLQPLLSKVFREEDYYKNLEMFLREDFFLLHGALIYGAPLMLTLSNKELLKNLFDEVGIDNIIAHLRDFYGICDADFPPLKFSSSEVFSISFALAIGYSVYSYFKELIDNGTVDFTIEQMEGDKLSVSNKLIDDGFKLLHTIYGQPEPSFKGEIIDYYIKKYKGGSQSGFVSGLQLMRISNPGYKANESFNSRNYFAHGGLELNITEVEIIGNKAIMRYNSELAMAKRSNLIKYMKK